MTASCRAPVVTTHAKRVLSNYVTPSLENDSPHCCACLPPAFSCATSVSCCRAHCSLAPPARSIAGVLDLVVVGPDPIKAAPDPPTLHCIVPLSRIAFPTRHATFPTPKRSANRVLTLLHHPSWLLGSPVAVRREEVGRRAAQSDV